MTPDEKKKVLDFIDALITAQESKGEDPDAPFVGSSDGEFSLRDLRKEVEAETEKGLEHAGILLNSGVVQ